MVDKQWLALFFKICVSESGNLSLALLIKVLLIKKSVYKGRIKTTADDGVADFLVLYSHEY